MCYSKLEGELETKPVAMVPYPKSSASSAMCNQTLRRFKTCICAAVSPRLAPGSCSPVLHGSSSTVLMLSMHTIYRKQQSSCQATLKRACCSHMRRIETGLINVRTYVAVALIGCSGIVAPIIVVVGIVVTHIPTPCRWQKCIRHLVHKGHSATHLPCCGTFIRRVCAMCMYSK